MSTQSESDSSYRFTITLEVIPESMNDADPALVDAIARDTADALRNDGYSIQSVYTGQRGGNQILVEVITFLQNVPSEVWAERDTLGLISSLCTIFGSVIAVAKYLLSAHKKRTDRDAIQQSTIKITTQIDGASMSIEAPDLESVKGALNLTKRFYEKYPAVAAKVTPQSNIRVKGSVPKRQPRKRR